MALFAGPIYNTCVISYATMGPPIYIIRTHLSLPPTTTGQIKQGLKSLELEFKSDIQTTFLHFGVAQYTSKLQILA